MKPRLFNNKNSAVKATADTAEMTFQKSKHVQFRFGKSIGGNSELQNARGDGDRHLDDTIKGTQFVGMRSGSVSDLRISANNMNNSIFKKKRGTANSVMQNYDVEFDSFRLIPHTTKNK